MIASARGIIATSAALLVLGSGAVARGILAPARASLTVVDGRVELRGLSRRAARALAERAPTDSAWTLTLALYVDGDAPVPPVLATYAVIDGMVRLTPRFPLERGVAYRVASDPRYGASMQRFTLPAPTLARTTRVIAVHPSAPVVPENLLRWYIQLSAPMGEGEALAHIHLLDAAGREVPRAFLRTADELWDPTRTRLTVLFDPGRVKRGIRTNEESGAPLVAGRRYRLEIDADWRDGRGAQLASGFTHPFEAGVASRHPVRVDRWRVEAPRAEREPLRVAFGAALDHVLASRMLTVVDRDGREVAGRPALGAGDSTWSFVPGVVRDRRFVLRAVFTASTATARGNPHGHESRRTRARSVPR